MNRTFSKRTLLFSVFASMILLGIFLYFKGTQTATAEGERNANAQPAPLGIAQLGAADNTAAPDFALTDLNGNTVHLSDFKGKVVILNFWATWCPPCRKEIPDFESLQKEFGPKGLQFIGIALDDEGPAKVKPFIEHSPVTYPILFPDKSLVQSYGDMNVIPVTYLIDRKGIIRTHYVGLRKEEVVEDMIRPLLAER